ncbi:uncharacterized protein LOC125026220 [Penaeus chinensis]|uniref:uncharacterized protein LOC125026220 n=1 Tax=Penaeus chinensis TaxID=139456 RepID=UPI001FB625A0|nr:uncharacterized protein LOC125026220 [Penaeus chinensis]
MAEKQLKSSTPKLFPWKCGDVRQMIFALTVAASKLESGLVIGWPSVLLKLQEDNSTRLPASDSDVAWLAICSHTLGYSMSGFTGVASSLFAGPLMEAAGPQRLLLSILLPAALLWLLQAFSPYLSLFYLCRVFSSLAYSLLAPLRSDSGVAQYGGELCPGPTGGVRDGLPLALAPRDGPVLGGGFKSPYWLDRQDLKDKALTSLKKLRGPSADVSLGFDKIISKIKERQQTTLKDHIAQLAVPLYYRPILLLTALFIIRELGGQYVIFSYSKYLYKKAGAALDAFACTLLMGGFYRNCVHVCGPRRAASSHDHLS